MTQQIGRSGSGRQYGRVTLSLAFAALILGGSAFYALQTLSRDDCTTVTTTMPDGSQVTTKTCS